MIQTHNTSAAPGWIVLCAILTLELLLVWQYGDLRSLIPLRARLNVRNQA